MKFYITLALWVLIFIGAATLADVEIPVVYQSAFLSPVLMAGVDMIVRGVTTLVFLIPSAVFGTFWTFVLVGLAGLSGHDTTKSETLGVVAVLMLVIFAPLMVFAHPYIMTNWVFGNADWAIHFSYWQYTALSMIVLAANWDTFKVSMKASMTAADKEDKAKK